MWKTLTLILGLVGFNLFGASPSFQQVTNIADGEIGNLTGTSLSNGLPGVDFYYTNSPALITNLNAYPENVYFGGSNVVVTNVLYNGGAPLVEIAPFILQGCTTNATNWLTVNFNTNSGVLHVQIYPVGMLGLNGTNGISGTNGVNGTNGLDGNNYDTNTFFWPNANYATTAGTATNSPIGLFRSAATNFTSDFDTNGAAVAAAQAATNGYPWGTLYDPTNAANNATNGLPAGIWTLGTASQSNAAAFDLAGTALAATNNASLVRTNDTTWFDSKGAANSALITATNAFILATQVTNITAIQWSVTALQYKYRVISNGVIGAEMGWSNVPSN